MTDFDVIVVGGGHAALVAAITAAENGARVCVLEVAPKDMRGGNTRHTRNLRPMHAAEHAPMQGIYDYDEYLADLLRVTTGKTNQVLAELTIRESGHAVAWLENHGVSFQPPLSGTLQLGRTNAFFLGGGKALVNALYACAESLGVTIRYETRDIELDIESGRFRQLTYNYDGKEQVLSAGTLVAAAGGFEANLEWLQEAFGPAAQAFLVRGTPYNRGNILRQLLDAGMQSVGEPDQCHAVAIDGRAPKFDGGIVSRVDCVPLGIVVNNNADRFYDEGEDFWPKRYAIWGRLIAQQPGQVAWSIVDSKTDGLYMPTVFEPLQADSIPELAKATGLEPDSLATTINEFNSAITGEGFDHQQLDGCHTTGLDINKSHWARAIDTPPFKAFPLRTGITFTYLGVAVDESARIILADGTPSENLFAAGELMAGNVLGQGYLAGIGMTIGNVFGRIAGREAASV